MVFWWVGMVGRRRRNGINVFGYLFSVGMRVTGWLRFWIRLFWFVRDL